MTSFFYNLQAEIQAVIEGDAWLADVPIILELDGDYEFMLDQAIYAAGIKKNDSGKVGIAMAILTPAGPPTGDADQLPESDLTVEISIIENPQINRHGANGIGKTGLEVIEHLAELLTNYRPDQIIQPMRWGGYESFQTIRDDRQGGLQNEVRYVVTFHQVRVIVVPEA